MTLVLDDDDRYSRFQLISWWDQARLSQARVMVVGAGALGNEVLKNLALVGVGTVIVVDCDLIETSNLTRSVLFRRRDCGRAKAIVAAEAVADLNPDVRAIPIVGNVITAVGLGLFRAMDVVVGCLDNREARLWVNRACWRVGRPWVDGGIQEISGVVKVFVPEQGPCYECAMTENDYRLINLRYSCPLLPREEILAGKVPTAPTIASVIAGWQAQEALKILHGMPVDPGTAMVFNGAANNFYKTRLPWRDDCLSHERFDAPRATNLRCGDPASRLFQSIRAAEKLPVEVPLTLALERDLVESVYCERCSRVVRVLRPAFEVASHLARCETCGEPSKPKITHLVPESSSLAELTLAELGVAPFDLVRVRGADREFVVELTADQHAVWPGGERHATP
ncbi:MAG: ThiF family adenylyltransferase [Planctomycetes bacterium]|nr:ThiF family adenylyltransferase [Planctomycetota bacterium]